MNFEIKYGVSQSEIGGFKPSVFMNGKWQYAASIRNTKTAKGALNRAEKFAKELAEEYAWFGNTVTVIKWEHSII